MLMNYVVAGLYVIAFVLEIVGLVKTSKPEVATDPEDQRPYFTMSGEGKRTGHVLVVCGLIVATVASFASMWAPGFV
ncbi:hypothetical protein [Rathayibacter sp. VKM Ac-2927]|uniref:hypothetical protein n=1 Tax=Rathayibacter sp. VKM Ac-2927 TaxID=2929478 RepID=UPI001FB4884A|nr:hypothetical protein [Rathayibacter sp. VKM Ac-2927]MCJ1687773.1 hypothetical protein [Rathayibacter sp. VKM Ac-2927]